MIVDRDLRLGDDAALDFALRLGLTYDMQSRSVPIVDLLTALAKRIDALESEVRYLRTAAWDAPRLPQAR